MSNTGQVIVTTVFITLLRSHIIDHGSLLYLTQQILLYNQQYVYEDSNNDSVLSVTVTSAVTMKITSYETYVAVHSVAVHSVVAESVQLLSTIHDELSFAIIMKTTVFHEMPFAFHNEIIVANNGTVSSAAVSRASPSTVIDTESSTVSVASNKASSAGNKSFANVTLRNYNTVHNLYFDTRFDTALDTTFVTTFATAFAPILPTVFDAAANTDMTYNTAVPVITKISFANYDEDSSADSLSSATYDEDSSAAVKIITLYSMVVPVTMILICISILYSIRYHWSIILLIILINISILSFG